MSIFYVGFRFLFFMFNSNQCLSRHFVYKKSKTTKYYTCTTKNTNPMLVQSSCFDRSYIQCKLWWGQREEANLSSFYQPLLCVHVIVKSCFCLNKISKLTKDVKQRKADIMEYLWHYMFALCELRYSDSSACICLS